MNWIPRIHARLYARGCIFTVYSVRIVIFTGDGNECNERAFCKYLGSGDDCCASSLPLHRHRNKMGKNGKPDSEILSADCNWRKKKTHIRRKTRLLKRNNTFSLAAKIEENKIAISERRGVIHKLSRNSFALVDFPEVRVQTLPRTFDVGHRFYF